MLLCVAFGAAATVALAIIAFALLERDAARSSLLSYSFPHYFQARSRIRAPSPLWTRSVWKVNPEPPRPLSVLERPFFLPAVPTAHASTSPFPVPDLSDEDLKATLIEQLIESNGRIIVDGGSLELDRWYAVDQGFITQVVRESDLSQLHVERRAAGFPFHFIDRHRGTTNSFQFALDISRHEPRSWHQLPVRFNATPYARINIAAFIINTIIFAATFLAAIAACGIIRCSTRLHHQRCITCNYDLSAHPHDREIACPECGFGR